MSKCPQCGVKMAPRGREVPAMQTNDHILPRERGGRDRLYGDTRNIRPMCHECNQLTAKCFHCVGVLACASNVASEWEVSPRAIINDWRIGYLVDAYRAGVSA